MNTQKLIDTLSKLQENLAERPWASYTLEQLRELFPYFEEMVEVRLHILFKEQEKTNERD